MDSHVDIPGNNYATKEIDPGIDNPKLQCDLVKMENGKIDGVFLAVFVAQKPEFDKNAYRNAREAAMGLFTAIKRLFSMYADRCEFAGSTEELERIVKSGKRAVMIGLENGYPIGNDLSLLEKYYSLGARYITLCHFDNNQICDSSTSEKPKHNGVSEFGRRVITEMNRLGIISDCSHISEQSFWDLIEISKAPIIASHSSCYDLTPHPRNLTDQQLKALAQNNGVIQICAYDGFLESKKHLAAINKLLAELGLPDKYVLSDMSEEDKEANKSRLEIYYQKKKEIEKSIPNASLTEFIDHIDHAVKVAGINHVGIGSDFDGGAGVPGFNNHAEAQNVTIELLRRGYSEEDILKIWGGNLLRVWKEVEQVSERLNRNENN